MGEWKKKFDNFFQPKWEFGTFKSKNYRWLNVGKSGPILSKYILDQNFGPPPTPLVFDEGFMTFFVSPIFSVKKYTTAPCQLEISKNLIESLGFVANILHAIFQQPTAYFVAGIRSNSKFLKNLIFSRISRPALENTENRFSQLKSDNQQI